MPVFPGSSSPSQRCSFHFAPFCQTVTQCSISVEVTNPSFCLNHAADFFPSETMTATLKSLESMAEVGIRWLFPFSPRDVRDVSGQVCRLDLLPVFLREGELFE